MIRRLADRVRAALALLGPLGAGSHALLLRLVARYGWGPVLGGAAVAVYAAVRYRTWIVWMLVAWCTAAWMHTPTKASPPPSDKAGEAPLEPDPQDVADLVRDLVGDDTGVLLTVLRQPLQAADTKTVRKLLDAAGIRVRPGVRTAAGNGPGVHRDDVPPPLPAPGVPDVGAVTSTNTANTNANNTLRVKSQEGMTIISDPADRHRTHSLKKP